MIKTKYSGNKIASKSNIKIKPEWEELCEECSSLAKQVGWTKANSRELLKKVRNESRTN